MPVRASGKKPGRKQPRQRSLPATLSVRLSGHIAVEAQADGSLAATFDGYPVSLGKYSAGALERAQRLRTGLPLKGFASPGNAVAEEVDLLVRRLARRGLVEYRLARGDQDLVVVEPQVPDYWPHAARPRDGDRIVLSRFACLRRRRDGMLLESPRAGASFRIVDPSIAALLATLSTPQKTGALRRMVGFPGTELLALLLDCQILFKVEAAKDDGWRASEGDDRLMLWDFHDLLFHTRSTEGRQANPVGGLYPFIGVTAPAPAVRPRWGGTQIDLRGLSGPSAEAPSPLAGLLRRRHSVRSFDDSRPITLNELARFLDSAARVQGRWSSPVDFGDSQGPMVDYTTRPYPAAGSAYELELYLAVANCTGLGRGFYHYDADAHALVSIPVRAETLSALLEDAVFAMDAPGAPQILIAVAARFERVAWKYSGIAYSLILKDVGVLIQTLYMLATDMGLGGCAIGTGNIDLFAKMTGIEFHVEGLVGQFRLGRGTVPEAK
jgi:SagB-type dehydrogenase family enzyme